MPDKNKTPAGWFRFAAITVALMLAGPSHAPAQPAVGVIKVEQEGQFVFDKPISSIQFAPSLKFEFGSDPHVRAAKVRVQIEMEAGPAGKEGLAFAIPATSNRWVEINSYQSDLVLEIPDGALPGTYRGKLTMQVEPKEIVVDPHEVRFSYTIAEGSVTIEWEKSSSKIKLGSVSTGSAGSFQGPRFTVSMGEGVESGTRLNFEAEDTNIWVTSAGGGESYKGIGALAAGSYRIVLNPEIKPGSYKGKLKFELLSLGAKINGETGAAEFPYELTVYSPMASILKIGGGLAVVVLVGAAVFLVMGQMKNKRQGGGKAATVEGTLEFVVPMERRAESLDRVGKSRIVFGEKGDLLKDVRRIHFEIAAFVRDGRTVVELTRFKDSCSVFVNGVDAFNVELFDGDMLKFGEYPTFEVKYRNLELVRPVAQVFGGEETTAPVVKPDEAPRPIGISMAEDDGGQLESLSGETRPMTANTDEGGGNLGMAEFDEPDADLDAAPAPASQADSLDLSLDLDLDIPAPADDTADGKKKKADSIDLPEGFDLLGDD